MFALGAEASSFLLCLLVLSNSLPDSLRDLEVLGKAHFCACFLLHPSIHTHTHARARQAWESGRVVRRTGRRRVGRLRMSERER